MSELKAIQGIINGQQFDLYFKDEVYHYIAELENERDAFEKSFNEMTESYMKSQRALWLSRAENAKTAKNLFDILWRLAGKEKVGVTGCAHKMSTAKTLKEPKFFFVKFVNVERKCRAKVEEYK